MQGCKDVGGNHVKGSLGCTIEIQINGNCQAGPPTTKKKVAPQSRLQKYMSPLQSRPASLGTEASPLPAVVAMPVPVAVVVAMLAAGPAGTAAAQVCQCSCGNSCDV